MKEKPDGGDPGVAGTPKSNITDICHAGIQWNNTSEFQGWASESHYTLIIKQLGHIEHAVQFNLTLLLTQNKPRNVDVNVIWSKHPHTCACIYAFVIK